MTGDGSRRLRALLCVLLLVPLGVVPARASVGDRVDRARERLHELAQQVTAQQAVLPELQARVDAATAKAANAERTLLPLFTSRVKLREDVAAVQEELVAAQLRLQEVAIEAYMGAPGTVPGGDLLGAALGATDVAGLQDRLVYTEHIVRMQSRIAADAIAAQAKLDAKLSAVEGLSAQARAVADEREAALFERADALADQRAVLDQLTAERDEIVDLLNELGGALEPGDVEQIARAFQGEHNVTYGEWTEAFLEMMGAPDCRANRVVTIAWQAQEGTVAAWNPLATTHRMPGSTDFNSVGVQNFTSLAQGLQATLETIENGWEVYGYGAIIRSMRACNDPYETAAKIVASSWCPGCLDGQYVIGVVPKVDANLEAYASI
jgi:hypothetical protein